MIFAAVVKNRRALAKSAELGKLDEGILDGRDVGERMRLGQVGKNAA